MFTAIKNFFASLFGSKVQTDTATTNAVDEHLDQRQDYLYEPQPTLGERFGLEEAPAPTDADDGDNLDPADLLFTREVAYTHAKAAFERYRPANVHVDPITGRVRVADSTDQWFWAEDDLSVDLTLYAGADAEENADNTDEDRV